MPRRPTQQQLFDELLDSHGVEIAAQFQASIDRLKTGADLQLAQAAIQRGDAEALINALHLDRAAFNPLLEAIRSTYVGGGEAAASYFPARDAANRAMVIRFDARNLRAEQWLREHSSGLVTRIIDDQRSAVRRVLTAGMEAGQNPRNTALDIVGRLDRATGRRTGGILGLTDHQTGFVQNARQELSGADPEGLRNYLSRSARDKRFDRSVLKAIRDGEPLPAEIQRKALLQYENRLLKVRGDVIGRTESLTSLRAAKHESYLQAVETGQVSESAIRRTWKSAGDLRVRHTHRGLNGDTVALREPFRSPSGARMMFPGDTSMGAPASETIGCRCDVAYRIDFLANLS